MDLYSKKSDFQSSSLNERCGQPQVQRKEVHSRVTAFSESLVIQCTQHSTKIIGDVLTSCQNIFARRQVLQLTSIKQMVV